MLTHAEMRAILAAAFARRFGRSGSRCELQCLQAVAWLETSYGAGWRPPGDQSKNLGACQAGSSWAGKVFSYTDTHPTSTGQNIPYTVNFRFYDTWEAAADDLVKIVYVNNHRESARVAAAAEDTRGFSEALRTTGYYEGFGATVGDRISHHHDAVVSAIRKQCAALNEPLPHDIAALPEVPQTVRFGSKGFWVRVLQEKLRARGESLTIDGGFGPMTARALQRAQMDLGLVPDGVCGPKTWLALG